MNGAGFCYLVEAEKGIATLEHEGQRFVPIFASAEALQDFCRRCGEQLPGYRLHVANEPGQIAGFLQSLRDLSLHVGIAQSSPDDLGGDAAFTVLAPALLADALTQLGTRPPAKG